MNTLCLHVMRTRRGTWGCAGDETRMTRNRARKQAIRAAAGEGGYARTARLHDEGSRAVLTADVQRTAVQAFRGAGWPTESEDFPEGGQWSAYVGPVWSLLSRPGGDDEDAHPDDAEHHDLTAPPAFTFIAPPISINTGEAMVVEVPGDTPASQLVSQVSAAVAKARAGEIAKLVDDAPCAVCGDPYPARHLLAPTAAREVTVCPSCVFDGDLFGAYDPVHLAYDIDHLWFEDLAMPAGWAAVAALLACAGGTAFAERLHNADALEVPGGHWSDLGQLWIWLPPHARPAALDGLGAGAGLTRVVEAVEAAHPDLRERFRTQLADELEQDADGRYPLVEQLWPAVIAYAITLAAQEQERPGHRPPWHVLSDSFEPGALAGNFRQLGSSLDAHDLSVCFTLEVGLQVVAEALGFNPDY
ncbi:hypothetical protein [Streptomyces flaveolus]|uniref:hypothetical protein n=1 Tax=Streptomyces flaveolus TaxID=67297 RepID=UPI0036FC0090